MARLWTKNGRPLTYEANDVFALSGSLVGRIRGDRVFRVDGDYVGTIVGDRLVFRSFDSEGPERPFTRRVTDLAGDGTDEVEPAKLWGDEPVLTV